MAGVLKRSGELAGHYTNGTISAGPLHAEVSLRFLASRVSGVREMCTLAVSSVSDSLLADQVVEVCGTVPSVVVGEISEAMINRFSGVSRGRGSERSSDGIAHATTSLLNVLGGFFPQSFQARHLRELAGRDNATGALVLSAVYALGGSAFETVVPAVLPEVRHFI